VNRFSILDFGFSNDRSKSKSVVVAALSALLFALCPFAQAQQAAKNPRIGFQSAASASAIAARIEAFRQGLRELGYVEGKNIAIEWRYAEGNFDRVPALAADLVRLNVDVIVTAGPMDTRAAKQATSTIPIVMTWDQDPVGSGFVATLARPGGNITGLSSLSPEISGKQLELLKDIVPRLSRAAFLGNSKEPGNDRAFEETEAAARSFGVQVQYLDLLAPKDLDTSFAAAIKERAQGILVLTSPVTFPYRKQVISRMAEHRIPAIYHRRQFVEDGGLMSYGVSQNDLDRRAATYVDKILKGAKPANLPIEQPTKFELVISLKAAKQIGLTIPPNVLARADKVIK
jgi:putative ABC transport system substrate-binding protein